MTAADHCRVRRRGRPVRAGDRAGDARRARHRVEDVLRLPDRRSAPSRTPRSARSASACPGALPVANEAAIEATIRIGLALNCSIATWCRFARKNYFYPDMPKNFQISQYDEPLCVDGYLDVEVDGETVPGRHRAGAPGGGHRQDTARRRRDRAHPRRRLLAGRLQPGRHPAGRDRHQAGARHRRAGARGGPGVRDRAARHPAHARRLRRADGAGLAALRRQHLAEPARRAEWGTRTETKNVNSLRIVERAVRSEMHPAGRACSTRGGRIVQETRHFHEDDRRHHAPGAARRRRPTTGTSPSPTSCRSRPTRPG